MNRIVLLAFGAMVGTGVAVAQSDSLTAELHEIVVKAEQPATRLVGSTMVTTVPGSNLQNLGTALDVLRQLPMVTVGSDGSVSVIGKGTPEILIDGRPMGSASELTQLRSDNLAKIEVMLSPGAMFDSETRSVIRITTRRNFIDGLSLNEDASVYVRRRFSADNSLNLNYHLDSWDFFVNSVFAWNNSLTTGHTLNRLIYDGRETVIGSSQHNEMPSANGSVKVGVNHIKDSQSFGAYWLYHPERGDFVNRGSEWVDNELPLNRTISNRIHSKSHLFSAYFEQKFKNKYLFHFDGSFRSGNTRNRVNTDYRDDTIDDVASHDRTTSTLIAVKSYLTFPLWRGDFSVGTEDSYTRSTLDYRMMNPAVGEYIPSSVTRARQIAAAGFVNWSALFGQLSVDVGLRYAFTDYLFTVNGHKDSDVSRHFNSVTPDLGLGWQFNERTQISLTYQSSTHKPPYSRLTGSLNYVGQHEIEGGNPLLRDEKMNNLQFFGRWRDFMFQADYTVSTDAYGFVKRLQSPDVLRLIMIPINIDISSLSCYLMWNRSIRWWTPGVTAGFYRQWLELDGQRHNRPIFSYYFNNTFALPAGFTAILNFSGSSTGDMSTNRFSVRASLSMPRSANRFLTMRCV